MKLPRIKIGAMVTLTICASIIFFRVHFVTALVMLILLLSGRASNCPFRSLPGSYGAVLNQAAHSAELERTARLVAHDTAGYDRYEVGGRQYWVPSGSIGSVTYDLAEQDRGIYYRRGFGATKGDVVLDAGANVGLYTIEALRHGARKVIAIEPVPANLECLRRNLEQEIISGRVVLYPKGIWDRDDILEMNINPTNQAADSFVVSSDGHSERLRLPLTTVDHLVSELQLESVDFIKMDIEGAERRALQGAVETIRRFHPRMAICVYHLADDIVAIPAIVRSLSKDYRGDCGPCALIGGDLRAQVMFF